MELSCAGIVRVTTRDDATPARRATADTQVGVIKAHALLGHLIKVWGLSDLTAIATEVIPRDVVGNEENEIWERFK